MAFMDARLCVAMSMRSRQQCRNPAVRGMTKCRMHGGKGSGRPVVRGLHAELLCEALRPLEDELKKEMIRQRAYVRSILNGAVA
jgi:hypothetical protein